MLVMDNLGSQSLGSQFRIYNHLQDESQIQLEYGSQIFEIIQIHSLMFMTI